MSFLGRAKRKVLAAVVPRFLNYDVKKFERTLSDLEIGAGDHVMVHASWRPHSGFTGSPVDMVRAMKRAVGPKGLLIMPSMTYLDSSKAFLTRGETMKVRRSPSRMGLLSEVFRRGKDVQRSLSPTHPLLACGERSELFLSDHEKTDRPFGPASPFAKLLDLGGKILCLDVVNETITFVHFLEDRIQDQLPFPLYEPEHYTGRVLDADGEIRLVPTRVLSEVSRKLRREEKLWAAARKKGILRHRRVGNTRLMIVGCQDLADLVDSMYESGKSFFDTRPGPVEL